VANRAAATACGIVDPVGEQIRKIRRHYYGLTSLTDHLFGDLLKWMRERGLLDNTIVVFMSDHGTHLADFGMFRKQTFFDPVLNVPLV
jgi:arylsulfatase A-like enzyme